MPLEGFLHYEPPSWSIQWCLEKKGMCHPRYSKRCSRGFCYPIGILSILMNHWPQGWFFFGAGTPGRLNDYLEVAGGFCLVLPLKIWHLKTQCFNSDGECNEYLVDITLTPRILKKLSLDFTPRWKRKSNFDPGYMSAENGLFHPNKSWSDDFHVCYWQKHGTMGGRFQQLS